MSRDRRRATPARRRDRHRLRQRGPDPGFPGTSRHGGGRGLQRPRRAGAASGGAVRASTRTRLHGLSPDAGRGRAGPGQHRHAARPAQADDPGGARARLPCPLREADGPGPGRGARDAGRGRGARESPRHHPRVPLQRRPPVPGRVGARGLSGRAAARTANPGSLPPAPVRRRRPAGAVPRPGRPPGAGHPGGDGRRSTHVRGRCAPPGDHCGGPAVGGRGPNRQNCDAEGDR